VKLDVVPIHQVDTRPCWRPDRHVVATIAVEIAAATHPLAEGIAGRAFVSHGADTTVAVLLPLTANRGFPTGST
jgi:hypothetical protein